MKHLSRKNVIIAVAIIICVSALSIIVVTATMSAMENSRTSKLNSSGVEQFSSVDSYTIETPGSETKSDVTSSTVSNKINSKPAISSNAPALFPVNNKTLNAAQEQKIKQDWIAQLKRTSPNDKAIAKLTLADVKILSYYGTYSGCEVLFLEDAAHAYTDAIEDKNIAGYDFQFRNGNKLMVYKNSKFLPLEQAYNEGWITKEDIRKLSEYFKPLEGSELKIKQDWITYLKTISPNDKKVASLTTADVKISEYYGTFSGCEVLFLDDASRENSDAIVNKQIAGYDFQFRNGNPLMVYKNSKFLTLEQAYNQGWLKKEDIKNLSEIFKPIEK